MPADRNEYEPDEPDPEADLRDPDSDSFTIPRIDTEDAGSTLGADLRDDLEVDGVEVPEVETPVGSGDVPPELIKAFWAIVLVANAALLAVSVGGLLVLFEGDTDRGLPLLAGGVLLFGFAVHRYRSYRDSTDD